MLEDDSVILDPTAGGGSIPFEAARLGFETKANELNPVGALVLKATVEYPMSHGQSLLKEIDRLSEAFLAKAAPRYEGIYPTEDDGVAVVGYLWAHTVTCPYCDGVVPLASNWRLTSEGCGVQLLPNSTDKRCRFEVVRKAADISQGTVSGGDATCPFTECRRVIDGSEIKRQAQVGGMRFQLYAVAYKRRVVVKSKGGKSKEKWVQEFRAPRDEDDNSER